MISLEIGKQNLIFPLATTNEAYDVTRKAREYEVAAPICHLK